MDRRSLGTLPRRMRSRLCESYWRTKASRGSPWFIHLWFRRGVVGMNDLYVGAYWKARKETIYACTDRFARFLAELSACDAVFTSWYKLGKSRRQAKQVEIDFKNTDCLLDLLERGRHRKDIGKEVIEELGFHVVIWNGEKVQRESGLSISCGLYSSVQELSNCVVINLPEELGGLRQSERMANVLVALATCWEPDWGGVISRKSRETRNFVPGMPFVDWIFYVSNKLALSPTVPEPSSVKPVDALGSLIVVQPEPVAADNPVHMQRVKAVETALGIK